MPVRRSESGPIRGRAGVRHFAPGVGVLGEVEIRGIVGRVQGGREPLALGRVDASRSGAAKIMRAGEKVRGWTGRGGGFE